MKRTMLSKIRRTEDRNSRNLEVDTEAVKVLRTVRDQEAFYFYEAIGKPTGEIARNLSDFLDKVKSVKPESLVFHLQRKDFQNWIKEILGDSKLARKLGRISSSDSDDIRTKICEKVEDRIKELTKSPTAVMVEETSAVLLS